MSPDRGNGLRVALDLQACQTASRDRGIGRYAMALSQALLAQGNASGLHRYVLGCDATYPRERAAVMRALDRFAEPAQWTTYDYAGFNRVLGDPRDALRPAARALVQDHYRRLAPSVVHVHSLFEGFVEGVAGLDALASVPGVASSVTLYDLIPLVFQSQYLADPVYRSWYESKLESLRRFDILLSLSAATSRDAERLLGIPADRMHVIGGGVSDAFHPREWSANERAALNLRFGIDDRFVLYTGNSDARKNLQGAVRAFAEIPVERRAGVQLVLNQVGDEAALRAIAKKAGLAPREVVVTGHVGDADLIGLLQTCEVFFFPSLYEGFGLPVLEAMACGAPVVAGDNSSIPEVLPVRDALFDAASATAGAAALDRVLGNRDMRRALSEQNLQLAREHTWERVARRATDAWDAHAQRTTPPVKASTPLRIAMVTPLPPDRSGIADYAVDLAAGMAPHCELAFFTSPEAVDAAPTMPGPVHPWQSLPELAADYDHVVYHFGNSPFHSHMVDLLDAVPGSVLLHDLFLSSMFWHMDRHEGRRGLFERELERSHGRAALKCVEDEGDLAARRAYPASRRILERATNVLVHSRHAAELAQRYFPALKRAPMAYVPMPIPARTVDASMRADARRRLGLDDDTFVVASFGFIADTKLSHRIVEAAAMLGDKRIQVVLVGANDGGDYGRALSDAARASGKAVRITGFVDAAGFSDWLDAADGAVQLRAMSRGESSKTVLDCLARGVPTIVNAFGAFAELPADVVMRLPSDPSSEEVRDAILALAADPGARALGERGRAHVESLHAPTRVGREMVEAFRASRALREDVCEDALVDALADALQSPALGDVDAVHGAVARTQVPWREARLYVDLTEVVRVDHGTGIHRVVRNVARELMLHPDCTAFRTLPVAHMESQVERVERFVQEKLGVPETRLASDIGFAPGDVVLLLDSAWESCERFDETIARVRAAGGRVGAMVYDLIPLRHPQYCVEFMPAVFGRWLEYVVRECDFIVCISRAVADDLKQWIDEGGHAHARGLRIGHVHLGADVEEGTTHVVPVATEVREAMRGGTSWLMVGTVEPRKRYDVALDAFDQLWKQGSDLKLVIAGKPGWNVESLVARIKAHPQAGKRLFWIPKISDADLAHAYAHARGLLQTSDAEGFGLPIVEAARFERPLVLSDIAVFREIAGEQAQYFQPGDAQGLADILARGDGGPARDLAITWRECANRLLGVLRHGRWDHAYGD